MSDKINRLSCVFVHGWAMNSAVWEPCLPLLPDWMDVIRVDLPGHGTMSTVDADSINDYTQALAALMPRPALWVGWSLGGLAVLELAKYYPERVAGIFLVSSTPCFVRRPDWPCAVEPEVFQQFADSLGQNVETTIKRFLALQVKGSSNAMKTVRSLQASIKQRGQASPQALELGLDILSGSDYRETLTMLECPVHCYLGGRDALVPVCAGNDMQTLNPKINLSIDEQAAHAPFVSHPESFVSTLIDFAKTLQ